MADVNLAIGTIRYYAGWADKIQGKEIPVSTWHDIGNDII
jgi:acyl-CoA reductase-like NAD-dependent aldehyde dehydrogenase